MAFHIRVRNANKNDINQIFLLGAKTIDFAVSKKIRFYEKGEISQWIKERKKNIVIIAENSSKVIGFLYCKIMSFHWALIDNFYIIPEFRDKGVGTKMEKFLEKELKERGINYISLLVKPQNKKTRKFLKTNGFKEHAKYVWVDKFLSLKL